VITATKRKEMRDQIAALSRTNYAIDCYGVPHVEAVYLSAVPNLKLLLDSLDEAERELVERGAVVCGACGCVMQLLKFPGGSRCRDCGKAIPG
jgi:hypothetical protein